MNMKKAIIVVIILLIVGLALTYIITQLGGKKAAPPSISKKTTIAPTLPARPSDMASWFPDGAAVYLALSDVLEIRKTVETSNYYKGLIASSFWKEEVAPFTAQLEQSLPLLQLARELVVELGQ